MYLNVNNPVNYQLQGFGQNGVRTISTDQLYIQGEYYRVLVADEDSYVTAVSVLGDDLTAEFVYAGTTIYGLFTEVSVSSGSLTAYIAGPTDIEDVWAYINEYGLTNAATIEAADCAKDAIAPLLDKYYAKASLVMVPSLYKTSIVYSERPLTTSGQLAFTRSNDTATRVGPDGYIEKVRTNLLLYSQAFTNTWFTFFGTTTDNEVVSPDGTQNASKVVLGSSGAVLRQSVSGLTNGQPYTFSCYIKQGSGVTASLQISDVGSTITLTNDWVRYTYTGNWNTSNNIVDIELMGANGSYCYIWGAQLEVGDIATNYIPTTTAAVSVGPVANIPRLNYPINSDGSVGCPSLLLEPQRTNLIQNSENLSAANWSKINCTVSTNVATAPDGTVSADKLIMNNGLSPTSAGADGVYQASIITSGVYSVSFFAKSAEFTSVNVRDNAVTGAFLNINLTNGVVTNPAPSQFVGAQAVNYGNGWYRVSFTTATIVATQAFSIRAGQTGDGTSGFLLWGVQYELGAYATSYIPTLGAAVTRATDTYQKGGFGNTSTAGTLFCEFEATNINSANGMYLYGMGVGTTDTLGSSYATSANALSIIANGPALQGKNNGYATNLFTIVPAVGATVKVAIRYDGTNVVAFVNGVKQTVYTDSAVGVKNFIRVNNGEQTSHATKQILFFPTALSDADAIALTA